MSFLNSIGNFFKSIPRRIGQGINTVGSSLETAGQKVGSGINWLGSKVGNIDGGITKILIVGDFIGSSPKWQGVEKALGIANTIGNTLQGREYRKCHQICWWQS